MTRHSHSHRPLLLLAYADSAHAARCGRFFRRHGWEVRLAASAAEARRLAATLDPRAIVVDTELPDECGWLTCAQIAREGARQVVLLAPGRATMRKEQPLRGWALATRQEPIETLAEKLLGPELARAV